MSGHSKWSTIKRKKEKIDSARAKVFTKIGKEIAIAVREGGSADPGANAKLRDCIAKAKANNVPNENIERIIKKASGENDGKTYEVKWVEFWNERERFFLAETKDGGELKIELENFNKIEEGE